MVDSFLADQISTRNFLSLGKFLCVEDDGETWLECNERSWKVVQTSEANRIVIQ